MPEGGDCERIVAKYVRELHEDFQTVRRDGECLVVTPYLLPDNDAVEILVKKKDGRYEISDMGTTLGFLYLSGVELRGHSKQEAHFRANLARFGVKIDQGELVLDVSESGLADGMSRVIEASRAVAYLVYTARARPGMDFRREVAEWLDENHVQVQQSVRVAGASRPFTINFVRDRPEAPPVYLQALHSETRGWARNVANETIVMWVDLRQTNRRFESVSLLDDTVEEDVWAEHLPLLQRYSDRVGFWEAKEELLEVLLP